MRAAGNHPADLRRDALRPIGRRVLRLLGLLSVLGFVFVMSGLALASSGARARGQTPPTTELFDTSSAGFWAELRPYSAAWPQRAAGIVTGTITLDGTPVTVTITNPGDTAQLSFTGTANHRLFVSFTNNTIGIGGGEPLGSIIKPDASLLSLGGFQPYQQPFFYDNTHVHIPTSGALINTVTLPTSGTYKVQIAPQNNNTGSITVAAWDVPTDPAPTLTPSSGGSSATMSVSVPGQNMSPTFTGTAGHRLFVSFTNNTIGTSNGEPFGSLVKPDGSLVSLGGFQPYQQPFFFDNTHIHIPTSGASINTVTLPTSGTYTLVVDPQRANTGGITVTAYDVPADATGKLALGGSTLTLTTTVPGQNIAPTFYADAARPVRVVFTVNTIGTSGNDPFGSILKPDQTLVTLGTQPHFFDSTHVDIPAAGGSIESVTLPTSGLYTLMVDPSRANTGSITMQLLPASAFQSAGQVFACLGGGGLLGGYLAKCAGAILSEPVDTLTGAFETRADDLSLPGIGIPFVFSRSYSSADTTSGRLGPGWTDSLSTSLVFQSNGDILVHAENGQQVYFAQQQDGSFVGAPGALATLTAVGGGYQLVRNDQLTYTFDSQGRLTSAKDRNNQGLTLAYNGSGQLTTITDSVGRTITLTYNGSGLLSQLSVPDGRTVGYAYTLGRLSSVTDVLGHTTSYTYDAGGRLATIVDQNGHTEVTNTYDANGRVSQQKDALNNTTTFAWNSATQTQTVTDPRGNTWQDVYSNNVLQKRIDAQGNTTQFADDANLNLTSVTGPDNKQVTTGYDTRGNLTSATSSALSATKTLAYNNRNDLTSVTDARGKVTTYSYDTNGNRTQIVQDGITVAQSAYNAQGQQTSSTDGRGNATTYGYDTNGNTTSVTDPLNHTTSYGFDSAGRPTSVTDPLNHTTSYSYDAASRVLTETDPLNHTTTYAYDAVGNQMSVTDANNHTTTTTYDANDRPVTVTAPDAGVTSFTYDTSGNKLTETDPLNHTTTYTYDSDNRLASATDPLGNKTTYSYDTVGNLIKTVDPRGNVQGANPNDYAATSTYDAAGRQLTQTDPLGNSTTFTYDKDGNQSSVKDANNHTTSYAYDGLNRLSSVTAPDGGVTSYSYDANGNLLTRTDANSHVTSYTYDADNHLINKTLPLSRQWTYSYNAAGYPTSIIDANGNATQTSGDGTTSYSYDAANRPTGISYSDSTPNVTFAYDAVGNRTSISDGAGTQTYSYDTSNRLTGVSRGSDTFAYTYDLAGNITRRTYPDGMMADNTYDADNNIASVISASQTTSYTYDPAGDLTQAALPSGNGYVETHTYDRAGRLTDFKNAKASSVLSEYAVTLDAVGNPTTIVRSGATASTTTYGYDANDRLTSACFQTSCPGGSDPFIRWTYDQVGNRLTEARPAGTTNYTYNAADELTTAGSATYTYDTNGNETAAGSRSFSYDLANRLTSTSDGSTTTSYSYDGDGNRLQASTGSSPSNKTNYLWDTNNSLSQLATERDGSGNPLRDYLYGNRRISMTTPTGTYYYHYDQLGSVSELTSSTGATEWTESYEPFGATRTETQNDPSAPTNPMKFAGELVEPTSLYYLRARQYDPALGRFLSGDPLGAGNTGSPQQSPYGYGIDQPTVLVDPSGATFIPSNVSLYAGEFAGSAACGAGVDRARVVWYLRRWAFDTNPTYGRVSGALPWSGENDCTNFISQALRFGCWSETQTWNATTEPTCVIDPFTGLGGCYGTHLNPSKAWVNVKAFLSFATSSGRATLMSTMTNAELGDVVVGDWGGGKPAYVGANHLMGITGFDGKQILISSHGNDHRDFPLYNFDPGQDSIKRRVSGATFALLHLK